MEWLGGWSVAAVILLFMVWGELGRIERHLKRIADRLDQPGGFRGLQ
jgi:hypothetical protein